MATSTGYFYGGYGGSGNDFRLVGLIERTAVSIPNNTSTVRFRVWIESATWGHFTYNSSRWMSLGGSVVVNSSANVSHSAGSWTLLMDQSRTITHKADGTQGVSGSATFSNPVAGNLSVGATLTLDTIPRATTPNLAGGGGFTTGSAKTINLPRASSSFTHEVTYKVGTKSGTISSSAGASVAWTPPHALATEFPTSASRSVSITVRTKSGSTVVGTKTVQYTITAGAAVIPTVSSVVWDDDNPTVKNAIGAFVQGVSLIKGSVTGSGIHNSTINEARLRVGTSVVPVGVPMQIATSGLIAAQGEVVDSRQRLGVKQANFTVLPYEPPKVGANGWAVNRANASNAIDSKGQYLRIDLHVIASTLKVANAEKNALAIKVETKASDGGWQNRNVINTNLTHNAAIQVTGGAAYLLTKSYDVRITVTDKTGIAPLILTTQVGTGTVTIARKGSSVGIGKYHERGALDVGPGGIYDDGKQVAGYVNYGQYAEASTPPSAWPGGITTAPTNGSWPQPWANMVTLKSASETWNYRTTQLNFRDGAVSIRDNTADDEWRNWVHIAENVVGQVTQFAGDTAPRGWLLCQGQAVSRTDYAALFEVIGTKYGSGNGSTTFNVPDLRGRVAAGLSSDTEFNTLGKKSGAKTHTLTTAQMPTHKHSVTGPSGGAISGAGGGGSGYSNGPGYAPWFGGGWNAVAATVSNAGSGSAHNNIQPTITLNYIIKT